MVVRIGRGRGHGRGQPTKNVEVIEEMRELRDCMEAVELGRQKGEVCIPKGRIQQLKSLGETKQGQ